MVNLMYWHERESYDKLLRFLTEDYEIEHGVELDFNINVYGHKDMGIKVIAQVWTQFFLLGWILKLYLLSSFFLWVPFDIFSNEHI